MICAWQAWQAAAAVKSSYSLRVVTPAVCSGAGGSLMLRLGDLLAQHLAQDVDAAGDGEGVDLLRVLGQVRALGQDARPLRRVQVDLLQVVAGHAGGAVVLGQRPVDERVAGGQQRLQLAGGLRSDRVASMKAEVSASIALATSGEIGREDRVLLQLVHAVDAQPLHVEVAHAVLGPLVLQHALGLGGDLLGRSSAPDLAAWNSASSGIEAHRKYDRREAIS